MTGWLRVLLIAGALVVMALVLWKIRKAQMRIADSTFWFLFSGLLVVFAVFPQVPFFLSFLIGIDSPSNFVFLFVIAALFVHEFYLTVELSRLRAKVARLVQHDALREAARDGKSCMPEASGASANSRASDDACDAAALTSDSPSPRDELATSGKEGRLCEVKRP